MDLFNESELSTDTSYVDINELFNNYVCFNNKGVIKDTISSELKITIDNDSINRNKQRTEEFEKYYKDATRERIRLNNIRWRRNNKEKTRDYRKRNKERIREYNQEYRVKNKEKIQEYNKKYNKEYRSKKID